MSLRAKNSSPEEEERNEKTKLVQLPTKTKFLVGGSLLELFFPLCVTEPLCVKGWAEEGLHSHSAGADPTPYR